MFRPKSSGASTVFCHMFIFHALKVLAIFPIAVDPNPRFLEDRVALFFFHMQIKENLL